MNFQRYGFSALALAMLTLVPSTAGADSLNPVLDDKWTFKLGALYNRADADITVSVSPLPPTPVDLDFLGIEIPPPRIDGIPVRSVDPLPLDKRIGGPMLFQMDPWMVKRDYGGIGMDEQWPMTGMTTFVRSPRWS